MNHHFGRLGIGILITLAGCVPSYHPLYTDADVVFEPALVGEWSQEGSKEKWIFAKRKENQYTLVLIDKSGKKGEFIVHLLKAEGRLFLDLYPAKPNLKEHDMYKMHLMPVHTFMRVKQIEPTLQIAFFSPEWIGPYLKDHPDAIQHEQRDKNILLTAKPKELQAFLLKHENTKDAFGDFSNMERKVKSVE